VYKTTSVIRQLGSSRNALESCTLSVTAFRNFLREVLFVQGKRVEIWQQKGRSSWEICKQASPGNLQDVEEDFAGQIESAPVILAVKIQAKGEERVVGVCFADASVRELGISEFADNEVYSNLEVWLPFHPGALTVLTNIVPHYPAWSEGVCDTSGSKWQRS
jgi:DNA mismatch repair protein MSH2